MFCSLLSVQTDTLAELSRGSKETFIMSIIAKQFGRFFHEMHDLIGPVRALLASYQQKRLT